MSTFRNYAGLIAAVILTTMGALLLPVASLPGALTVFAGIVVAVWWALRLRKAREDRYDLRRLWDEPLEPVDEADEEEIDDDGTLYCHHCGHSVPPPLRVCPECGNPLG